MGLSTTLRHTFKSKFSELAGKAVVLLGGFIFAGGVLEFLNSDNVMAVLLFALGLVVAIVGKALINHGEKHQRRSVQTPR